MTVATDLETSLTFEVQVFTSGGWIPIHAVNVIPSMDMDRVPYCDVRIEFAGLDYATFREIDPRNVDSVSDNQGKTIRIRVLEFDSNGDFRANLVRESFLEDQQWAQLIILDADWDEITGEGSIVAANRETVLEARIRLSGSSIDTAATDVLGLVYWSLTDCFGGYSLQAEPLASATSIPSGDRRLFLPGESHSELLEPELQAIGYRLFDYWGRTWFVNARESTPLLGLSYGYERTLQLASYTQREGAPPNADPIVYSIVRRLTRAGDYADGVLIKFDTLESGGSITYQRSGDGSNTKGRVLTWKRTAPGGNAADEVVKRTKIRGEDITITARARLDVTPGQELRVFLRDDRTLTANIRAVSWNIAAAEMTIRAQAGRPEE